MYCGVVFTFLSLNFIPVKGFNMWNFHKSQCGFLHHSPAPIFQYYSFLRMPVDFVKYWFYRLMKPIVNSLDGCHEKIKVQGSDTTKVAIKTRAGHPIKIQHHLPA